MAKEPTLDIKIKRLLNKNMLNPLFFSTGIHALKYTLDNMSDEDVYTYFSGLFPVEGIRCKVDELYDALWPKK